MDSESKSARNPWWQRGLIIVVALLTSLLLKPAYNRLFSLSGNMEPERQAQIAQAASAALNTNSASNEAVVSPRRKRVEAAFNRFAETLVNDPTFRDEVRREQSATRQKLNLAVTSQGSEEIGARLAAEGMVRLSAKDFLEIVDLRLKLAESSAKLCAGFWSGGITKEDLIAGFEMLSDEDLNRWMALSEQAIRLQLSAKTPLPRFPEKVFIEGAREILDQLPEAEKNALMKTMEDGVAARPADGCKAFLQLVRGGLRLASQRRDVFLRAVSFNSLIDWKEQKQ